MKNFSPIGYGHIRAYVMAKKCMPLYGIIGIFIDFLAHKLAKY